MDNEQNENKQAPKAYIYATAANGMEVRIPADQYESWKAAQDRIRQGKRSETDVEPSKRLANRLAELIKEKETEKSDVIAPESDQKSEASEKNHFQPATKANPKRENKKEGFIKKHSYIGCLIPIILVTLFPFVMMFIAIWNACGGNIGYFIINILAIPLTIIGIFNLFRGFCAVVEKDEDKFASKKYWQFLLYILITIAGYFAVALAIVQFVKWNI